MSGPNHPAADSKPNGNPMAIGALDPRTPVIVGVGQVSESLGADDYKGLSPVELATDAVRAALDDAGADASTVAEAIDTAAGIRQFEISTPHASAPLGRSNNFPRSVTQRVGAAPKRAILEVGGGQAPQHLVTELAGLIAAGRSEVAVAFGAEAMSTIAHFAKLEGKPDFSEHIEGDLEDRGFGLQGLLKRYHAVHGLTGAADQYALFDNARRTRMGQTREQYALGMGELFAPFTKVAAGNVHAASRVERSATELATVSASNRFISEPYTRYLVAREKVNQGAAVLIVSLAAAQRLRVPRDRWVFLHGHADLHERDLLDRVDLSRSPAAVMAARHAMELAGIGVDDISTFDLYSCFPIAVSNVADGLGIAVDDPRGLTVTGGLPFFGGPGNNYSMHAIAETVHRMRQAPGTYGFVGANGGMLSKYSVGIYSTKPTEWRPDRSRCLQSKIDALPAPQQARQADGWATVETWTLKHVGDKHIGIVVGRLEADGRRFLAQSVDDDDDVLRLLSEDEPAGARIFVRSFGFGNRIAVDEVRMEQLFPTQSPRLRERYEHVLVDRDGPILEVTINRPAQRNSLHPPANAELDEIFDAYFADPDLWVAVLTGAGDRAFCAGNDLAWAASGKSVTVPKNGFAGLTSRRNMTKPVIAAVNGFAMGGGCEIALACHLIVADADASFALSEVKVGLVAGAGGLVRLPRALPHKVATEMILTGRRLTAQEALHHGLVSRVSPAGQALQGARELAAEIVSSSPTSVRTSLQIMGETDGIADTVDAVAHPSSALDDLIYSEDASEGIRAFAEKRPPIWRNR